MPLVGLYERWLTQKYWSESRADEVHRVMCTDGTRVAVKRFLPAPGSPKRNHPILCVPGLGADSTNFDAPEPNGLAPYFARMGFDTYALDLRGTGLSEVDPNVWSHITYDDFLNLDVRAALEHVRENASADSVLAVGHSMGGLLLYSTLAAMPGAPIHAAVTICSPLGFPQGFEVAPGMARLWRLGEHIPGFHSGRFLRWLVPLALSSRDVASERFVQHENVDRDYIRKLMFRAVQNVPRGVLLQFRDWVMHDTFRSKDGTVDYRARLVHTRTPVLVVAAPNDRLARIDAVARALPLLTQPEYLLASKSEGFRADYGHIDIVFGREAHDDVFPRLLDFLIRHDEMHDTERRAHDHLLRPAAGIH
jgi:pimeloyl-ACP methyl ester carboxylesterase